MTDRLSLTNALADADIDYSGLLLNLKGTQKFTILTDGGFAPMS